MLPGDRPPLSHQSGGLEQGLDDLLQEERIALCPRNQALLERPKAGILDVLTALESVEMLPRRILGRYLQQRQEGWQSRPESLIEREQLAGDLLTDASR